jgi:hypothetical protein
MQLASAAELFGVIIVAARGVVEQSPSLHIPKVVVMAPDQDSLKQC